MVPRFTKHRCFCLAGIFLLIYFAKSFYFTPTRELERIDLRYYENLRIISPVSEPRVLFPQHLFLLVIVSSSPNERKNAERRQMLRMTWANANGAHIPKDVTMRIVFMLGKAARSEMHQSIMEEVEQHGDMLIGDYEDTYRNITTKLLMAFQWATKIKCHYVLKTDDDVYIDIPKLVTWLKGRDVKESIYGGVTYNSVVVRRKSHKHYVSPHDLSLHRYPLYCRGSMFVLSRNLIPKMVDLSKQIRRIGPDDAYIGILAQHLGVNPIHMPQFFQNSYMPWLINFISACELQRLFGIGDSLSPDQMSYIHQLKTTFSSTESLSTVCVNFVLKFWSVIFSLCTVILIFFCKHAGRIRIFSTKILNTLHC